MAAAAGALTLSIQRKSSPGGERVTLPRLTRPKRMIAEETGTSAADERGWTRIKNQITFRRLRRLRRLLRFENKMLAMAFGIREIAEVDVLATHLPI